MKSSGGTNEIQFLNGPRGSLITPQNEELFTKVRPDAEQAKLSPVFNMISCSSNGITAARLQKKIV